MFPQYFAAELDQYIDPNSYTFAENLTFDLHDIVNILLRERLLSEPRFKHSQLLEVCDGSWPVSTVPLKVQEMWSSLGSPKVGYFLTEDAGVSDADPPVEPHNFLRPNVISARELDTEEVETMYWRIKHHDSGFILCSALQLVLDTLPQSTSLRVRTSQGFAMTCGAQSFVVAEMQVFPKETTYICNFKPRPDIEPTKVEMLQYLTGEKLESIPWIYLVFGEPTLETPNFIADKRVAVDLVSPMLGMRGPGGETFVMESMNTYHHKILPRYATADLDHVISYRINPQVKQQAIQPMEIAMRVLSRLEKIARGEEAYCGYCGKTAPKAQCSRCRKKTKYCAAACQKKAWKYHKTWCKIDAASEHENDMKDTDVAMDDA
ncbi:hypothetical protein EW145_g4253 [Phellinidium pouzarii]|uniref:MYND-type domain-containing protein n=1 Tax=Phellinidium pouzarii TaxID=167371 RepID=A0A4S4L463_9AGAM|nr:hypothetical protein EW145_g4253 [Phellinidium pouzarii]